MTEQDFQYIISTTKKVVLTAIKKNIYNEFYHAIDDIAQETYIRVFKALQKNQFRNESKLSTWIFTIARNETIRMNNKLSKEEQKKTLVMNSIQKEVFSENNLEDNNHFNRSKALALTDKLPETYSTLMKYYIEGYTIKEISKKLNLKQGTVKSRTSRGKIKLQQLINSNYSGVAS